MDIKNKIHEMNLFFQSIWSDNYLSVFYISPCLIAIHLFLHIIVHYVLDAGKNNHEQLEKQSKKSVAYHLANRINDLLSGKPKEV